jgi:hypothetical protein
MQVRSNFIHLNRAEHNSENKILNGYHMSKLNHFFIIIQNDMVDDVERMLMWHDLIGY